jgi:hypothetical protein
MLPVGVITEAAPATVAVIVVMIVPVGVVVMVLVLRAGEVPVARLWANLPGNDLAVFNGEYQVVGCATEVGTDGALIIGHCCDSHVRSFP